MNSSSLSLDNSILLELDKFSSGSVKRRIVNELVEFVKKDAYIDVEYKEMNNQSIILLTIVLKKTDTIFQFHISRDYPFKPPMKFKINFKDYIHFLKIETRKTLNELKSFYNINCLCCNNLYCGNINWSPTYKLQHFINEFMKIKKYRYDIVVKVLCKKIVEKYLILDINLIQWLSSV
jgi:ubiquitin-protein ligase